MTTAMSALALTVAVERDREREREIESKCSEDDITSESE